MLALQGVPGIYVHSLIGSHNNHAGLAETGRARTINREKWQRTLLEQRMADPQSHERQVFEQIKRLIRARRHHPAFHPNAPQRVLELGEGLFALLRGASGNGQVLCLQSVSHHPQTVDLKHSGLNGKLRDLISGMDVVTNSMLGLEPYAVCWLATV